jgi:SAM-dependent methyltransferase
VSGVDATNLPAAGFASELDAFAATLLDRDAGAARGAAVCAALHSQGLRYGLGERATILPAGHALAPADAARCVLDHVRTACLVRALDARIAARAAAGPVRVLYAGCGPLAPLALLLARRWRGHVVFDLVDIHAQSIEVAQRLFERADARATLGRLHCADAAALRLDEAERPHILVAETMQRALMREPQVAVVANLWPQCAPGADLVPELIAVDAMLGWPGEGRVRPLGRLLRLATDTLPAIAVALREGAAALPEVRLQVPMENEDRPALLLATRIEAGPGELLEAGDSGLTTAQWMAEVGRLDAGETLGFAYRFGHDPGFVVRRIRVTPR